MSSEHDKLFKAVFQHPHHAAVHFKSFLPAPLLEAIDVDRAILTPGSFIDEQLAARHSDLLFHVPLRSPEPEGTDEGVFLYILFEHQSTIDDLMAYRLLRYMVRIWETQLAEQPQRKRLSAILPLVLYHGPKDWTAALQFFDLLDLPAPLAAKMQRFCPSFSYLLDNLSARPDAAMPGHGLVRVTLRLFKHIHDTDNLPKYLLDWVEDLKIVKSQDSQDLQNLKQLIEYIIRAGSISTDQLVEVFSQVDPRAQELTMTLAEQLHNEGREEGLEEGLEKGREALAHILLVQLQLRFGDLDSEITERVRAASLPTLEAIAKRFVVASSIRELFCEDN